MVADLFLALAVAVVVIALVMLRRNGQVYRYRMLVLAKVTDLAQSDIAAGRRDWARWYEMFDEVDYDRMVDRFWRPLDSFYPPELRP